MLLLLFALISLADAWSHVAHKIVARVAGELLSRKAARFVRQHLEESIPNTNMNRAHHALVKSSTWADFVTEELPWSSDLHFSHTPYRDCQEFVLERDCGFDGSGRCVVTAIGNYTLRAADASLSVNERREALKFLVHLVADAHSPVHVGFARDFGGNAIDVVLPDGSESNLHEVWDSKIFGAIGLNWLEVAHDLLDQAAILQSELHMQDLDVSRGVEFAAQVVSETSTGLTCNSAYRSGADWIEPDHILAQQYMEAGKHIALSQLSKAAVRLAQLIEVVAAEFYAQEAHRFSATTSETAGGSENSFNLLGLSVDLEECVFELADEGASEYLEDEREDLGDTSADAVTAIPTREDRRARRRRAKETRREIRSVSMHGIDFRKLVLLKRANIFSVTFRDRVTSDSFVPNPFLPTRVQFGARNELILFDRQVVRNGISHKFVEAVLRFLGGVELPSADFDGEAEVRVTEAFTNVSPEARECMAKHGRGRRPFGRIPVGVTDLDEVQDLIAPARAGMSKLDQAKQAVRAVSSKIVLLNFAGDSVIIMTRIDWLKEENLRFVFNEVLAFNPSNPLEKPKLFLFDARLVDTEPDQDLMDLIDGALEGPMGAIKVNVLLARRSRPVMAFANFSNYITQGMQPEDEASVTACFERINRVPRRDHSLSSFEFVIRK